MDPVQVVQVMYRVAGNKIVHARVLM